MDVNDKRRVLSINGTLNFSSLTVMYRRQIFGYFHYRSGYIRTNKACISESEAIEELWEFLKKDVWRACLLIERTNASKP